MSLKALDLDTDYHTGKGDLASSFYQPCLEAAVRYDRAAGYFRSSVLELIGTSFARFAHSGGIARLVCSPSLTEVDVTAAMAGYDQRTDILATRLGEELSQLLSNARTARAVELLATLVRLRAMEIQIALRPTNVGLYHEKLGIFRDLDDNLVTFRGSANESRSAWDPRANHESFEVFCSWTSQREAQRCGRHVSYFEQLWNGNISDVQVISLPHAFHAHLLQYSRHELSDFIDTPTPSTPTRIPLPHQRDAIAAWHAKGQHGILKHATGSGKTFTAITAMRSHLEAHAPVLVLVPSILLLTQWVAELESEFPDASLLVCGGGSSRWRDKRRLRAFSRPGVQTPRIIVSTMQTAATDDFRRELFGGPHLMLVADEVHQLGSTLNRRLLTTSTGPRLGLSATPERFGDADGTAALFDYFGGIVPPIVTLSDAIQAGRLVPYNYYPHSVDLTADELESWSDLSDRIAVLFAQRHISNPAGAREDKQLAHLLIARARIAKLAINKTTMAADILAAEARSTERWLVYCEDSQQLQHVRSAIAHLPHRVLEYHSAMSGAPRETLEDFRYYGGVLLSIRCLDEGIDIPEITHALILASSQNPRQFIQRRGRVLRRAPHKNIAVVHDALVIPPCDPATRGLPSLVMAEVARSAEFARDALNATALSWLRRILIERDWDAKTLLNEGDEATDSEEHNGSRLDGTL